MKAVQVLEGAARGFKEINATGVVEFAVRVRVCYPTFRSRFQRTVQLPAQ